jgi:hypothetical protein
LIRANRVDRNEMQGRSVFGDHRGMRDSWSSGAEWAGSDDFEDNSEFRTRRPREYSTDSLGSEVERRLMEDFFQVAADFSFCCQEATQKRLKCWPCWTISERDK